MSKRYCPECGVHFEPEHPLRVFCSPAHKKAYGNRQLAEAGPLLLPLKAWRKARHKKGGSAAVKWAWSQVCIEIDRLNAADKAAGRPDPIGLLEDRYRRQGLGSLV